MAFNRAPYQIERIGEEEWQSTFKTFRGHCLLPPISSGPTRRTIRFTLNKLPEEPYPEPVWHEKVDVVWGFIFARRGGKAESAGVL